MFKPLQNYPVGSKLLVKYQSVAIGDILEFTILKKIRGVEGKEE